MKPNIRLTMLPRTMKNYHLHVKLVGSKSKNTSIANSVNSLSVNDNDETNNTDECIVNAFRSYNNNSNNSSKHCNNQINNKNVRFNKSTNQRTFRGKCHACKEIGHHSSDCRFIKKLMSCLRHM